MSGSAITSRWSSSDAPRGADYDARWKALEASGASIHGEADLVSRYDPSTVLDAGCGTGRVAIEMARRGVETVGVDLDPNMLATARAKAPELGWVEADLASLRLERRFDVVVAAGNVMIFLAPGSEAEVVAGLAGHVGRSGVLIAGFEVGGDRYGLDAYDADCAAAGLALADRYATWHGEPWRAGGGYAVSVHRPD